MAKKDAPGANVDVAKDKGLQREVADAVDEAESEAKHGNVASVPQSEGGPAKGSEDTSGPTGHHRPQ